MVIYSHCLYKSSIVSNLLFVIFIDISLFIKDTIKNTNLNYK